MPASEKARVELWHSRVRAADKLYDNWSEQFATRQLEDYYLGKQWRGLSETDANKRYVINLFFSTIETNKPSLIFNNPQARITAQRARADDLMSRARQRAELCQDTVQTFIDDPDFGFMDETSLALHESHFRFGICEVGYSSDYFINPDAGRPYLKEKGSEKGQPKVDSDGKPVIQPEYIVTSEQCFIRRIPASQFRVSISNKNKISRNDWVGYWEWHYVEDLKRNPVYKAGARGLKASGSIDKQYHEGRFDESPEEREQHSGMTRVWKIWDLRTRMRYVIAQDHDKFLLEDEPFKFLPFSILHFYPILDSFYPLPPTYNWIGPQDEVNETRDAQRAHRRRFYRRYTILTNSVRPTEIEKFETGGDGVWIEIDQPNAIQPVQDAPLSSDVWQHLDESKVDFLTVSGVSGDQRGVAESETATQANIIDQHARLRESAIRARVQNWLADICRLILLTIREDMTLPFWVKRNVDMSAVNDNKGAEILHTAMLWKEITAGDLDEVDLDVNVDLSSMSPVAEKVEKDAWLETLALITKPEVQMILSMSPVLLEKTLRLQGIKSKTEQAEIAGVLQNLLMMQTAQAMAATDGPDGPAPGGPKKAGGGPGKKLPPRPGQTPAETGGEALQ